ncbi:MAG: PAS domain-containing protein [Bacteroidota bacterium]
MSDLASDILQKRILASIPFGFIQVDLNGQIVYANNSAFKLLELGADRLLGLSIQ